MTSDLVSRLRWHVAREWTARRDVNVVILEAADRIEELEIKLVRRERRIHQLKKILGWDDA